jgi:hypothetical protein
LPLKKMNWARRLAENDIYDLSGTRRPMRYKSGTLTLLIFLLHPTGAHAADAVTNLNEGLTDDVIQEANATGGESCIVEARNMLRKNLASLRLALTKVSTPEKAEL